jgi:sugar phosphate isomerase/epimerase
MRYNGVVFTAPSMPLSLALVGLTGPTPRAHIEWAARVGYRAVQLNAAVLRPRDLGRSARRDLAALLRRSQLRASGVDLWIPPTHLHSPEHADRATAALIDACGFAADMAELSGGQPVLSVALPQDDDARPVIESVCSAALERGVRLADHTWPPADAAREGSSPHCVGVDPAAIYLAEGADADPAASVSRLGPALAAVRLSDVGQTGRVAPGSGRLDTFAYAVAVATSSYAGDVVVDLRTLTEQETVARDMLAQFGDA